MPKGKTLWWVLKQGDKEVFVPLYRGADKKRAREVAAKHLNEEPEEPLIVARVSSLTVLSESHLKQSLPKDAF